MNITNIITDDKLRVIMEDLSFYDHETMLELRRDFIDIGDFSRFQSGIAADREYILNAFTFYCIGAMRVFSTDNSLLPMITKIINDKNESLEDRKIYDEDGNELKYEVADNDPN